MLPINRHPTESQLRSFRFLWLPLFVAGIGAMAWWRFDAPIAAFAAWILGGLLVVGALRSRETSRIIFVGMQTLTYPIALVVSTAALAILFYLIFTPVGAVMRIVGHDPLQLTRRKVSTGWVPHHQKDDPAQALKQY